MGVIVGVDWFCLDVRLFSLDGSSEESSLLEGKTVAAFVADCESKARALLSLPHLVSAARALFLLDPSAKEKASSLITGGLEGAGRGVTLRNCLDALTVGKQTSSPNSDESLLPVAVIEAKAYGGEDQGEGG